MSSLPVLRSRDIRALEAGHANADPPLMERAGAAVAAVAREMLGGNHRPPLILAGPGNNGGDGFVAARLLREHGLAPMVAFCGDVDRLPPDARGACEEWKAIGGQLLAGIPAQEPGLVIDALFGIGIARPVEGRAAEWIAAINGMSAPVLAVDLPSGLDADTGNGRGPVVRADRTLTFIALKPGLLTAGGPDCCGRLDVDGLGIGIDDGAGRTIDRELFRHRLLPRAGDSHKGMFGNAAIVGGAPGMVGATLLAGRAALRLGAGRVYLGMIEPLAVDPLQPELMLRAPGDAIARATALACGPGLGQEGQALACLRRAIDRPVPLLLDADALNLLAAHPVLAAHLGRREAATILTPHPAEAARLLGIDTAAVQADRLAAAAELAARMRCHVVLKGNGTIVVTPAGRWYVNTTGNPGLASAGSGDVLTGMVVALLAQHWSATEAALAAVHLHGAAADECVAAGSGPIGLTAGEIATAARALLNRWIANA